MECCVSTTDVVNIFVSTYPIRKVENNEKKNYTDGNPIIASIDCLRSGNRY